MEIMDGQLGNFTVYIKNVGVEINLWKCLQRASGETIVKVPEKETCSKGCKI